MEIVKASEFIVRTDKLQFTRVSKKVYDNVLGSSQVLLEIEKISFTSNNITYGVVGDQLNYWKFFPTEEGYGIIPAWGFGKVIKSKHPDIQVNEKFYGYFPMSTHLLVTVGKNSSRGFVDNIQHRRELPPVYNFYTNVDVDSSFTQESEDIVALFRPLFLTSFLIEDKLAAANFYEANRIVLTSASSKTAQALAFLLGTRKIEGSHFELVGLTSKSNVRFVESLGWYDTVLSYDEVSNLSGNTKCIIVDFKGNHDLQYALQIILDDYLIYNCLVGITDWQYTKGKSHLPNKGEFFFAPKQSVKKQKEWGHLVFHRKVGIAWSNFFNVIEPIIKIREYYNMESIQPLYLEMLNGNVNPGVGNILYLNGKI